MSLQKNFLAMDAATTASVNHSNISEEFKGTMDRYNGITVDSEKETCSSETFKQRLLVSLKIWQEKKIRGVWFKVSLKHADWVPILAKQDFWFHHAKPEGVTMCRWLPENEACNIPEYCHTMIGVAGLVTDSQGRLLVVKERFADISMWKLPGGYVEKGEDIGDAAVREVLEETGLHTRFSSLVAFRHSHGSQFGCSDMYLIAHLIPDNEDQPLVRCEREIEDCCWMQVDDYLEHPEVHGLNRLFVRKFLENKASGVSMPVEQTMHPVFKNKKVSIFTLDSKPQQPK
ncbi:hypothetical protein B566_EDAN006627 [Ephemera danica]|nr:hypothetical protein B566_EDAN006627 [Ephemera danica]